MQELQGTQQSRYHRLKNHALSKSGALRWGLPAWTITTLANQRRRQIDSMQSEPCPPRSTVVGTARKSARLLALWSTWSSQLGGQQGTPTLRRQERQPSR